MTRPYEGPELTAVQIDWNVVEEHFEEAQWLLYSFEGAHESPVRTLAQLAGYPEQRLLAHVDALVVTGAVGREQLLLAILTEADPAQPFQVATAALAEALAGRFESWLPSLARAPELRTALSTAARLGGGPAFDVWLREQLVRESGSEARATWLELAAARGFAPPSLFALLQDPDPSVVAVAARAARYADASTHLLLIEWLLQHESAAVRAAAIPAGLAWGSARAWSECERVALNGSPSAGPMLALYAALGGAREHAQIMELLADNGQRARALFALGHSGNASLVPCLLASLDSSRAHEAKLAAQAISMISGIDLLDDALARAASSETPAAPFQDQESLEALPPLEEDDLDAGLEPPPEEELPMPHAEEIARRFTSRRLDPRQRLLEGEPYTPSQVLHCLEHSALRRRHVYAEAYAIRTGGKIWIDTRTSSLSQRAQIAQARALAPRVTRFVPSPW
ncbi:MAG TPA: hypothetical protein VFX59_16500 [Polyangiales bacterium]|nr:hypothetical protein [Polyangiales bacterium]